jgi:DNA-nicking Smr family endonuclease
MRHASGWFEAAESRPAFLRSGMQTATLKRLRSGHWPVCAELDLHGLTRYEALDQLAAFLQWARARGNTVRVIHGKGIGSSGEAVLKQLTRSWLTHHPEVLAFCETSGGGALLVLLRRMTNV